MHGGAQGSGAVAIKMPGSMGPTKEVINSAEMRELIKERKSFGKACSQP
jgi:hypothetical protein